MKKTGKILCFILFAVILIFMLVSCKSASTVGNENENAGNEAIAETSTPAASTGQISPKPETSPSGQQTQGISNTSGNNAGSNTGDNAQHDFIEGNVPVDISKIPKVYVDYIKKKLPDADELTVMFYAEEDIDADGNMEAVIATGNKSGNSGNSYFINNIFLLRNTNGVIEQFGDKLADGGSYSVYRVGLVSLQGMPYKYIYCGVTNSVNITGFYLIELKDGKTSFICYSASPSGAGSDNLVDLDKDGKYDGYVQYRWTYDVLYYPTERTYLFKNGSFVLDKTKVNVKEYPKTAKDVVMQYLTLKALTISTIESTDVDVRLSELFTGEREINYNIAKVLTYDRISNTILGVGDGLEFEVKENGNTAEVIAFFTDGKKYETKFNLIKNNDRWVIEKITPPDGIEIEYEETATSKTLENVVVSTTYYDIDNDGKEECIKIVLDNGKFDEDPELWAGNGPKWIGYFTISVLDGDKVLSSQSLNDLINQSLGGPLFFWAPEFSLVLRDYNADGKIDFNIGQYFSSNVNTYMLFTVDEKGKITKLPVENREVILVSGTGHSNSTDMIIADEEKGIFQITYYDITQGRYFEETYQWNHYSQMFLLIKKEALPLG